MLFFQELLEGFFSTLIIFQRSVTSIWESVWLFLFPWKCSVPFTGWNRERTWEVGETL